MLYNVLVVDDNKRSAQGLAAMINVLGHTVGIAYGPRMAMQQLNEVIPDIIFLDVNMPGINGIEVLRYLRRDPYTTKLPVVIVSANDSDEDRKEAFDAGANEYIIKPPMIEDIEAVIERILINPAQTVAKSDSAPVHETDGDQPSAPKTPTAKKKARAAKKKPHVAEAALQDAAPQETAPQETAPQETASQTTESEEKAPPKTSPQNKESAS